MKRMILITAVFCVSCGESEHSELKEWMDSETQNMRGKIEQLPEVIPYEPFIYNAYDVVSPFSSDKLQVAKKAKTGLANSKAPNENRVKEPLESFDLEKLKMIATISIRGQMYGYIKTPEPSTYRVKSGSYIGQNFGVVTQVTESGITIKETIENSSGEWEERVITLPLDEQEQKK